MIALQSPVARSSAQCGLVAPYKRCDATTGLCSSGSLKFQGSRQPVPNNSLGLLDSRSSRCNNEGIGHLLFP